MDKIVEISKKILAILKKIWWLIAIVIAFIFGVSLNRKKKVPVSEDKEKLQKRQQELEKDLEKLKKEAEEREKTNRFDNPDDASDHLNDVLRRIQDNSKK